MQGVLIRYPFGISTAMIAEMSMDVKVYCLVSSSQRNAAYNSMENGDVNMQNVEFILSNTDSYWTRDYGPWWVVDGQNKMAIVDFTTIGQGQMITMLHSKYQTILMFHFMLLFDIVHCGGNYMTDGLGIGASSELVLEENDLSDSYFFAAMFSYYGVDTYHVVEDPNNTYRSHRLLGKVFKSNQSPIREVPETHPQYDMIEQTAQYFSNTLNKWGEPWELFRIWTPNNQPYSNSLILNNKVLSP